MIQKQHVKSLERGMGVFKKTTQDYLEMIFPFTTCGVGLNLSKDAT